MWEDLFIVDLVFGAVLVFISSLGVYYAVKCDVGKRSFDVSAVKSPGNLGK